MLDKKLFTQKDVDLAEKKFTEKAEKDVKKEAVINTFIENNKIDKSEVRMYQKLTEKGQAKEQINKIAEKINNTPPLTNRSGFENVDINDSDLAKLIAFKRLEKVEYASGNKKYFTTPETKKDLFSKIVFDNKNITIEDAQGNYDTYLFVNGNPDLSTVSGRESGAARTIMRQFIKLNKDDVVEVRNYQSHTGTINNSVNPGGSYVGNNKQFMLFLLTPTCDEYDKKECVKEPKKECVKEPKCKK
jgi:hypothetical protein